MSGPLLLGRKNYRLMAGSLPVSYATINNRKNIARLREAGHEIQAKEYSMHVETALQLLRQ